MHEPEAWPMKEFDVWSYAWVTQTGMPIVMVRGYATNLHIHLRECAHVWQ